MSAHPVVARLRPASIKIAISDAGDPLADHAGLWRISIVNDDVFRSHADARISFLRAMENWISPS